MMENQPVLLRRQVRLAAIAALSVPALGIEIDSPGDWSTPPDSFPAILLRTPSDRKESKQMGQPEFDTTVTAEILARAQASTEDAAQDAIEALCFQIERLLLTNHDLIQMVQRVTSVDTATTITSDGRKHLAEAKMTFAFEAFEAYDPFDVIEPLPITSFGIHVDAVNVVDSTGVYPDPPFPASVTAAPRSAGPDGRDEGGLELTISQ